MTERQGAAVSASSAVPVTCPGWCQGCGPNDPMHRGLVVTIGRERSGWISVQLLLDRFARRDLAVKVDATRQGVTQSVLLSAAQLDRFIGELTAARTAMQAPGEGLNGSGEIR